MKTIILEELILALAKPPSDDREIVPILTLEQVKKDPVYYGIYKSMENGNYWADFSLAFKEVFGFFPWKLVPSLEKVSSLSEAEQLKAINTLRAKVVEYVVFEKLKNAVVKNQNEEKLKKWMSEQSELDEEKQSPLYKTLVKKTFSSKQ